MKMSCWRVTLVLLTLIVIPTSLLAALPGAFTLTSATPSCSGSSPQITLNWTTSSGATTYDVYRNGSLLSPGVPAGTLSFLNTSVTAGTTYTYFIRARNTTGTTDSGSLQATAPNSCGGSLPGAFTLTNATPSCSGSSPQISLNWTTSSGATTYDVYRDGSLLSPGVPAGTLSFLNTSVTAGATYTYFIRAKNATGTTDSGTLQATAPSSCGGVATSPGAPQNLIASAGNGQNGLFWNAPSSNGGAAITSYRVYRGTNSSNEALVTSGSCGNLGAVLGCTDTGLTNGQAYYYFVSAVNSVSAGPPSNTATATPGVAAVGLPTINYFTASPDEIAPGAVSTLAWQTTNASSVVIAELGDTPQSGTTIVGPQATTDYHLSARNVNGTVSSIVSVRVTPRLVVVARSSLLSGDAPLDVTVSATASGGLPPYSYHWSTGETAQSAQHRFPLPGRFDVSCTVSDKAGTTVVSDTIQIIVHPTTASILLSLVDIAPVPEYGGFEVSGIAADGVTKIALQAKSQSPGSVKFSFTGRLGAGFDGGLMTQPGATPLATTVTVHTHPDGIGGHAALAYYQAPGDFAGIDFDGKSTLPKDRSITFAAHFSGDAGASGDIGPIPLTIARPPLVLIHGIWSGAGTWDKFSAARDPRFGVTIATWDGYSSIAAGALQVLKDVYEARNALRRRGTSVTRVDVVAHSMGGLIARYIDGHYSEVIHKLITLDTPHDGSKFANLLFNLKDDTTIRVGMGLFGDPIDKGCIDDLRTGSPERIAGVKAPSLPGHAIIGNSSAAEPCSTGAATAAKFLCFVSYKELGFSDRADCNANFSSRLLGEDNDEIVGVSSQAGGSPAPTDVFKGCQAAHTEVTSNSEVSGLVTKLLDAPSGGGLFAPFPTPSDATVVPSQLLSRLASTRSATSTDSIVGVRSPVSGVSVTPGQTLTVLLSLPVDTSAVMFVGPENVVEFNGAPASIDIQVPRDMAGSYTFRVFAATLNGVSTSDAVTIEIVPEGAIRSLLVSPISLRLAIGEEVQLRVQGYFGDGQVRDLSVGAGTVYQTGNGGIAVVDDRGRVHAVGTGSTTIRVSNSSAVVDVSVMITSAQRTRAVPH